MKLKLDVVNKWQEPPDEVETVKFWVLPRNNVVIVGATLPSGRDITLGFFEVLSNKICLALMPGIPDEYFRQNSEEHSYIYTY